MRKLKAKWKALLLAVSCFAVCLGVGVTTIEPPKNSIVTASAETVTRSMTKIAATAASSKTAIYFYAYSGDEAKSVTDWTNQYTFVEGTGDGVKYNGETLIGYDMKQPGNDIYFGLGGKEAVAGDILTLDGTFRNETLDSNIVIDSGALTYNGSSWDRAYYTHNLGEMVLSWPSEMAAHAENSQLYITPESGETVPYPDGTWSTVFTYESGDGLKKNDEVLAMNEMKSVDSGLWFSFAGVEVGDVVSISGTYSCTTEEAKYVLAESKFTWNGNVWENYEETPEITYIECNVSDLTVHVHSTAGNENSNNTTLWLFGTGIEYDTWAVYTYESGAGVKLNDAELNATVKEFYGGLYLEGFTANTGDVISIEGTFANADQARKYIVAELSFKWDGSGWEKYVEYTTYTLGTLAFQQMGNENKHTYLERSDGQAVTSPADDNGGWTATFTKADGIGITLNDEAVSPTLKFPGCVFLEFGSAPSEEDILAIGGTFVNDELKIKYVIDESKFIWTGSGWETYVEYTIHNLGALELHVNSSVGGASGLNNVLYLQKVGGAALPVLDWDHVFTYESGDGWKVNGVATTLNTFKSTNDGLYLDFEAVPANAVVSISGTFVYSQAPVKYVIDESKFVWNGSNWEKYVEYTEYNVSNLTVHANSTTNTTLWISMTGGATVSDWPWFKYVSGAGFKVNGETAALTGDMANAIQDFGGGIYFKFAAVEVGDIVSIGGTFTNVDLAIKYIIPESQFVWTGSGWNKCNYYTDSQLAPYDVVTLVDLGLGVEKIVEGVYDGSLLTYAQSAENTTGSVKFRFQVNSVDTTNGVIAIRLRGSAWSGVRFEITEGVIRTWNETANSQRLPLSNNIDYIIELGAIDVLNSDYIWAYIKIDGLLMASEMLLKTEISDTDGEEYGTYNTNAVSLYVNTTEVTFADPDHVSVTYVSSCGSSVDYAEKYSSYDILDVKAKTYNTFIGWVVGDALYRVGDTIEIGEDNITATAAEFEFFLEEGAAIRLAGTADQSGIRFTTYINEEQLFAAMDYVSDFVFGTLIIPYDYLATGQEPNLEDFTPGKDILKIESTKDWYDEEEQYIIYHGAMQKLYVENYGRLFAGRGYMEITLANGEKITVYTPFDEEDNVRSIRQIAQAFQADTSEPAEDEIRYATLSETRKAIVDDYAALDEIELMNYAAYAANNFLNVIAWNYPALDESNEYNNATNIAIATQMKNTGIKVVNLTGKNLLVLNTAENIEKTRQIIKFFWSQGLKTVAFAANNVENFNTDFTQIGTPDFSDCEGFIGFMHWDEPTEDDETMSKLADLAIQFNNVYAGSDVIYMNNLLPSYAPYFQTTETNWWGGSSTTLDKDAFKAYVEEYCTKVLSQVKGEKWLSIDSYPINKDYSLHDTFLLDLGVIKYYAMQYGAHAHVALQSSGFSTADNDTKARIPTEAEMRMQAYAALAFGMDSISWFTYSPSGSDSETFHTFVDNDGNIINQTAYDAFTAVNTELNAIGAVYSAFDWKGVILGAGKNNEGLFSDDTDYNAFETVSGQIGDYELSVTDTKHLSSVATNKTDWNYLMSVMQDANGNEGYVLCNYNSHEEDRAQTITLTFNKNITEVVIYRGGVAQTVSVTNNTLAIELATGEGVIVLPSKLG